MLVPIDLLIEQERKRKQQELERQRPVLRIPVPEYPPDDYRTEESEMTEPQRGVIIIDMFGEEERY
tara:strand:- start:275 stop:472 length:198 start_codon:yes stop_codon:yes gene_type:complete